MGIIILYIGLYLTFALTAAVPILNHAKPAIPLSLGTPSDNVFEYGPADDVQFDNVLFSNVVVSKVPLSMNSFDKDSSSNVRPSDDSLGLVPVSKLPNLFDDSPIDNPARTPTSESPVGKAPPPINPLDNGLPSNKPCRDVPPSTDSPSLVRRNSVPLSTLPSSTLSSSVLPSGDVSPSTVSPGDVAISKIPPPQNSFNNEAASYDHGFPSSIKVTATIIGPSDANPRDAKGAIIVCSGSHFTGLCTRIVTLENSCFTIPPGNKADNTTSSIKIEGDRYCLFYDLPDCPPSQEPVEFRSPGISDLSVTVISYLSATVGDNIISSYTCVPSDFQNP